MNLLAIDTSSSACALGLQIDGERVDSFELLDRTHSREILPRIESLLAAHATSLQSLDAIVFGQGPGSFTGIRIAVGVVQGLGFGLGIPVVPVSSLAVLAQSAFRTAGVERAVVALHARADEFYYGRYEIEDGIAVARGAETIVSPSLRPTPLDGPWTGVGDGWRLGNVLESIVGGAPGQVIDEIYPCGLDLIALGEHGLLAGRGVSAAMARPEYLRETVANKAREP